MINTKRGRFAPILAENPWFLGFLTEPKQKLFISKVFICGVGIHVSPVPGNALLRIPWRQLRLQNPRCSLHLKVSSSWQLVPTAFSASPVTKEAMQGWDGIGMKISFK